MKIVIYGAGSPYSPEILKELALKREHILVGTITLYDIDERRLFIMRDFLQRFAGHLQMGSLKIEATMDRDAALAGAAFVITQYRVGGNAARVQDERIPMRHGFIGQETTGPGGMMKALRTIPVAVELGRAMERLCPDAWLINYTNPSGMIAEAMLDYTNAKCIGLCAGGIRPAQAVSRVTGCAESDVRYDFFGLNHCNFAYNITIGGKPLDEETLAKVFAQRENEATAPLLRALGLFPSGYMQYYFRTAEKLNTMKQAEKTRGEHVQTLEKAIYEAYAHPSCDREPDILHQRGGGGYSQVAIGTLQALYTGVESWLVCNVRNQGTVRCLPDDAVIETACVVNATGAIPLPQPNPPKTVWGLVSAVKNYEQLAIEAAVTGDRDLALAALVAHPLVRDADRALPLLNEMLEVNRQYLPAFFGGEKLI